MDFIPDEKIAVFDKIATSNNEISKLLLAVETHKPA